MPRVKRGNVRRAKRKKLLARAKGFYQTKSKLYRSAKESAIPRSRRVRRPAAARSGLRGCGCAHQRRRAREHGINSTGGIGALKASGNTSTEHLADLAVTTRSPLRCSPRRPGRNSVFRRDPTRILPRGDVYPIRSPSSPSAFEQDSPAPARRLTSAPSATNTVRRALVGWCG